MLSSTYVTSIVTLPVPLTAGATINTNNSNFRRYGTLYVGNIEYKLGTNGSINIMRIHNPEGFAASTGTLYYYRKDHLGNNREVWTQTYGTNQTSQYYPSGLPWETNSGDNLDFQPYKYGGKEFVEAHALDEYDSEARWCYPAIMRTTTMDPLAEKYYDISPYAWCGNNPVKFVDLGGDSINFFVYEGQKVNQVSFSRLDANIQKALVTFAQTKVGYNFLSQFATKGETFGSKEMGGVISFAENGKSSEHNYNLMQFSVKGADHGDSGSRPISKGQSMQFDVRINTIREDGTAPANYAITIAHENFVHLFQHLDNYADFYNTGQTKEARTYRSTVEYKDYYPGTTDHRNYSKGIGVGYKLMIQLGNQNPQLMPFIRKNINQYK